MFNSPGAGISEVYYIRLFNECYLYYLISASRNKIDDEDEDIDDNIEDEDDIEDPFEIEPSDDDILESDFPLDDPEDDLLDDEDEIPYN